jgi:hypothetical protein
LLPFLFGGSFRRGQRRRWPGLRHLAERTDRWALWHGDPGPFDPVRIETVAPGPTGRAEAALWVWESSWPFVVRLVLVVGVAGWTLLIFMPKGLQSRG